MNRVMLKTLSKVRMITSCFQSGYSLGNGRGINFRYKNLQKKILLIVGFLLININVFAQNELITVNVKEKPFKTILREIEKQCNFTFCLLCKHYQLWWYYISECKKRKVGKCSQDYLQRNKLRIFFCWKHK